MKFLLLLGLLLFYSCATQEIQMIQMPLKLTGIKKEQTSTDEFLTLKWQSLDGHISVVTNEPTHDSNQYVVGLVYARCFLRR